MDVLKRVVAPIPAEAWKLIDEEEYGGNMKYVITGKGGQFLNALGSGLTLSLIVVYLHSVRGLPITTATRVCPSVSIADTSTRPASPPSNLSRPIRWAWAKSST